MTTPDLEARVQELEQQVTYLLTYLHDPANFQLDLAQVKSVRADVHGGLAIEELARQWEHLPPGKLHPVPPMGDESCP